MGYNVKTDVFEGPFDLLLHLVSRQKLDVNAISISDVADQYLEHIDRMADLDLDVASEFLVLAATLLEIKASSLLPRQEAYIGDELDDLSPQEARDILVARLIAYKQFKNAAGELSSRMENENHMHPRQAGLETQFLGLMPDYLEGLTLHALSVICADLEHKREVFLLEAEHVASMPISLELHAESVRRQVSHSKQATFSELVGKDATPEVIVVTFLAILELYKRGLIDIVQDALFGDIVVSHLSPEDAAARGVAEEDIHE
ncbi:MAG: segregation/condensation protein A [Actinobacteria bacterium HGW-Actinobacteria-7]|nr:MAG: segregation/condensation protein A [Actinobacteria bacterium HGW-Actinobacteria-7]